jgi:hypothetical protein
VDGVVGNAQDTDREALEGLATGQIVLELVRVIVDAAVELEDEALRRAVEVDDEAGDELLAAELESVEGAVAEDLPGSRLGVGGRLAEAPGELELVGVDVRVTDDAR